MTTPNTIKLRVNGRFDEGRAGAILSPGHFLEYNGSSLLVPHSRPGGRGERIIAIEDGLRGSRGGMDAYAVNDVIPHYLLVPGDVVLARLKAGANAAAMAKLASAGDGSLVVAQGNGERLYAETADSAVITNTTAETAFDKSYTLPANTVAVGDVLKITGFANIVAANSTDTLNLKLKIGSTIILATGAVDVAAGDTGYFEATVVVRAIGAVGSIVASGESALGTGGTATVRPAQLAATAIDTTADQLISVTATWSVANAGNQVKLQELVVELERASGGNDALCVALEAVNNSAGLTEAFIRVRAL
jgi:hypothetical protein